MSALRDLTVRYGLDPLETAEVVELVGKGRTSPSLVATLENAARAEASRPGRQKYARAALEALTRLRGELAGDAGALGVAPVVSPADQAASEREAFLARITAAEASGQKDQALRMRAALKSVDDERSSAS